MTSAQTSQAADFVVLFLILTLLGIGLLSMLIGYITDWRAARSVKPSADAAAAVMSHAEDAGTAEPPSSLETDGRPDADRPEAAPFPSEKLLPVYRLMRARGIGREEAREALQAAGLPLNSNVWAKAAPPPPQARTPFAGRPYDPALYHQDKPELQYQPPDA